MVLGKTFDTFSSHVIFMNLSKTVLISRFHPTLNSAFSLSRIPKQNVFLLFSHLREFGTGNWPVG